MSRFEKAVKRLRSCPTDYTFEEAAALLEQLGFMEDNKGKTSGSRVRFMRPSDKYSILMHRPHPKSVMKPYAVKDLLNCLEKKGML